MTNTSNESTASRRHNLKFLFENKEQLARFVFGFLMDFRPVRTLIMTTRREKSGEFSVQIVTTVLSDDTETLDYSDGLPSTLVDPTQVCSSRGKSPDEESVKQND